MDVAAGTIFLLSALSLTLFTVATWRFTTVWRRHRGTRLVTCPETNDVAAVTLDARRTAAWALVGPEPDDHLASCSRWETRGRCDTPCLPQVVAGGEDSTVRALVDQWYAGKTCVLCGRPVVQAAALDHRGALMDTGGRTIVWADVRPEKLPDAFQASRPVCWNCHIAEQFRRLHPELVVDRERPPAHAPRV